MDDHDSVPNRFSDLHLIGWIRRIVVGARPNEVLPSTDDAWDRLDARMHAEPSARSRPAERGEWRPRPTPGSRGGSNGARHPDPRLGEWPAQPARSWLTRATVMRTAVAVAGGTALIATVALVREYAGTSSHTGTYTVYSTRAGQRATVSLRDGTRVTLNVASTLEVPRDFGAGRRNVHLVGEAMFDVAHHDDAPFVVDAAGVRTRVLGTTFGVRAYDGAVRVAVQSGRVAVTPCNATMFGESCRGTGGNTVLNANDVAAVTPLGDVQVRHTTGVATELAFASGRLMFTGAPLHAVLGDLNRWYDVDVRVSDPTVANQALSGSLPQGTADDLVQALEVILGARVTRQGRVITVSAGTERR